MVRKGGKGTMEVIVKQSEEYQKVIKKHFV